MGERDADMVFVNCIIAGNWAAQGDRVHRMDQNMRLTNCTLASNVATSGTALTAVDALDHCILWDGDGLNSVEYPPAIAIYSDVQSGYPGQGNIDVDPLFVRPGYWADANDPNLVSEPENPDATWVAGDYHLQSQAGHWDPEAKTWVLDPVSSPCIDAGDPGTPIGDEPFPNGGILNLGAYGDTAEASRSYFGEPLCEAPIAGDVNGDCKVDFVDANLMSQSWRVSGVSRSDQPPTVVIATPADGATIEVTPSNPIVRIVVNASDVDGSVRKVKFAATQKTEDRTVGTSTVDSSSTDGWLWQWDFLDASGLFPPGPYVISAYAIDDDCEIAFAPQVHITVKIAK